MTRPPPDRSTKRTPRKTLGQVFAWPMLLLVLSLIGLILGLTGDGARDALSWALLLIPVALATRFWLRRTRHN